MVLDVPGGHGEAVDLGGSRRCQRPDGGVGLLGQPPGGVGGGVAGLHLHAGQVLGEERPALRQRVGVRHDRLDVGDVDAGDGEEVEVHRDHDLALDEQVVVERQQVEGDGDRTLDGVLDGDEPEVDLARVGGAEHVGDRRVRHEVQLRQVGLGEQRLLGEGAGRTEEAEAPSGVEERSVGRCGSGGHDGAG